MNYINQLNIFFRLASSADLTSSARMLYVSLLHKNNTLAWIERFTCSATELESLSGLSQSGLTRARKQLIDKQLIGYKKRKGRQAPEYSIPVLTEDVLLTILTGKAVNNPVNNPTNNPVNKPVTLTKLNKTKLNEDEEDTHARESIFQLWQEVWGFPNAIVQQDIDYWLEENSGDVILYAMQVAAKNSVSANGADKYIERTLDNWQKQDVKTVDQAKSAVKAHDALISRNTKSNQFKPKKQVKETLPDWAKHDQSHQAKPTQLSPEQQAELDKKLAALKQPEH